MANPQIENGYTAVANEILDHLYKQPLNGTELKVVMCILRYTFGLPDTERILTVSKNRLTGRLALGEKAIKLYFDEASKRISDNRDDFRKPYEWEADRNGFMPVSALEQMEIPFD